MKKVATIADLSMNARYCRDLGHSWAWSGDFDIVRKGREIIEASRLAVCIRCDTSRVQVIEIPSMRIKTRKYGYPDNYLGESGSGITSAAVREHAVKEFLARMDKPKRRTRLRSVT